MKSGSRNLLILFVALLLGLASAGAIYVYLQSLQVSSRPTPIPTVQLVVAATDIPGGTVITADMLKLQALPVEAGLPNALKNVDEAVGKTVVVPISAGEQLLASKIQEGPLATATPLVDHSRLANVLPTGRRAISVAYSEIMGAGSLIHPGDAVDVIVVFRKETMGKDQAMTILQNVPIVAISQQVNADTSDDQTDGKNAQPTPVRTPAPGAKPQPTPTMTPQSRPTATPIPKTATLSVTLEQAQRLALAEDNGHIRLVLRPAGDSSMNDIVEAQLSTIKGQNEPEAAQITGVSISPTDLKAGDTLEVKITVKNTSNKPLQSQDPKPEYTYVQGQTFHSQGFASESGKWRVGINLAGQTPVEFPYRWGFGSDLQPGVSTTITGHIKITSDFKPTNFWAGLINEPAKVVQDNVGMTAVRALAENAAVVAVDMANVRSGPSISSGVIAQIPYGTQLQVLGQNADWYKIKLPDQREGWVAAGWIVTSAR